MVTEADDRARRQAEHERPPKGLTREEWLRDWPQVEQYEAFDTAVWGEKP